MTNTAINAASSGLGIELGSCNSTPATPKNKLPNVQDSADCRNVLTPLYRQRSAHFAVNRPKHISRAMYEYLLPLESYLREMQEREIESGEFTQGLSRCIDILDSKGGAE